MCYCGHEGCQYFAVEDDPWHPDTAYCGAHVCGEEGCSKPHLPGKRMCVECGDPHRVDGYGIPISQRQYDPSEPYRQHYEVGR